MITTRGQEGSSARERIYWELLRSDNAPFLVLESSYMVVCQLPDRLN